MESDFRFWLTLTVDAAACVAFFHVGVRLMCLSLLGVAGAFLVATVLMAWAANVGSAMLAGAGYAIGFLASLAGCACLGKVYRHAREI